MSLKENGFASLLDTDLYKLTMQQAVYLLYPEAEVEYLLINRRISKFPEGFASKLKDVVENMRNLKLSDQEAEFLRRQRFLTPGYIWYLKHYRYDPNEVEISERAGELSVRICGPWHRAILWEVPLMAAISELYFDMTCPDHINSFECGIEKGQTLCQNKVKFADFGTRRRFSYLHHKRLLAGILTLNDHTLVGTSNVHLAMTFGLRPIGTQAHEWYMFHGAERYTANRDGIEQWIKIYGSDLGIALTDTYTTDYFLDDFGSEYANLFNGVRQDSGDPFTFADKMIRHYESFNIDPTTKTIIFSDGLTPEKAAEIKRYCGKRIRCSFGIGTNLTNDVGVDPLHIVIKLTQRKVHDYWRPTIKLSDDVGKRTGDSQEIMHWLEVVERMHQNRLARK